MQTKGKGISAEVWSEKGKEGVHFVKWYCSGALQTHLTSGNDVEVVNCGVLFMDVLLASYLKHVSLESISGAKSF